MIEEKSLALQKLPSLEKMLDNAGSSRIRGSKQYLTSAQSARLHDYQVILINAVQHQKQSKLVSHCYVKKANSV